MPQYLQFSSWTAVPPAVYKICIKWVKIAFHTPSSNSCRRSTTKSKKKLKRNLENRSENAFFGYGHVRILSWLLTNVLLTWVGVNNWLFSSPLMWLLFTAAPFSNMNAQACSTFWWWCLLSTWLVFSCFQRSYGVPILGISVFLIRQWGHGHSPRNLMQARMILSKYLPSDFLEFPKVTYSHASEVSGMFPHFWGFRKSSHASEVSESSCASGTLETLHSFRGRLFSHRILSEFTSMPSPIT